MNCELPGDKFAVQCYRMHPSVWRDNMKLFLLLGIWGVATCAAVRVGGKAVKPGVISRPWHDRFGLRRRQPLAVAAACERTGSRRLVHRTGRRLREALDFKGSSYPGIAAKIFHGLPFGDMQPNWTYTYGRRGLAVPGKLFVLCLSEGGDG